MAASILTILAVLANTGNKVIDDHVRNGGGEGVKEVKVIAEAKDTPVILFDNRHTCFSYNELYVGDDNMVHISTRSMGVVYTRGVSLEEDIAQYNKDVTRKIHNIVRL